MNGDDIALIRMTHEVALFATGLGLAFFVILLFQKPADTEMKGIQRLAARLNLLFCVAVVTIWLLSNYVTPA